MYHDELRYRVAQERHARLLAEATRARQEQQNRIPFAWPGWRWAVAWHPVQVTVRFPILLAGRRGQGT